MRGKESFIIYKKKRIITKKGGKNDQNLVLFGLPVQPKVHFEMMNQLERKTYSRCFLCLSPVFTSSCFIQRGYSMEINDISSVIGEEKILIVASLKEKLALGK